MTCKKCLLWEKRELPRTPKKYYPTGRCLHWLFNRNSQRMFTAENTNCDCGEAKAKF